MRPDFERAKLMGVLVKTNSFDTKKGKYRIDIKEFGGHMYFFKYQDGKLVEACDLSQLTLVGEF